MPAAIAQDVKLRVADCDAVTAALLQYDGVSRSAIETLMSGLRHAATVEGDGLHQMQMTYLDLVEEAVQTSQAAHAKAESEAAANVREAKALLVQLGEALKDAQTAEESAETTIVSQDDKVNEVKRKVAGAEKDHKKAEKALHEAKDKVDKVKDEIARVGSITDGALMMLVENGAPDGECCHDLAQPVLELLKELEAESAMIVAATSALSSKPEGRLAFDQLVVSCVTETLQKQTEALNAKLVGLESMYENVNAEALGWWAIADVAQEEACKAGEQWFIAKSNKNAAITKRAQAENDVSKQQGVVEESGVAHRAIAEKVATATAGLTALKRLRDNVYAAEVAATAAPMDVDEVALQAKSADVEMVDRVESHTFGA